MGIALSFLFLNKIKQKIQIKTKNVRAASTLVWNGVGGELMKRGKKYLWFLVNLNLETMKAAFPSVD